MKTSYCEANRLTIAIYKERIDIIQAIVCDYLEIPLKLSQAHTRKRSSIKARRRIHTLCREFMPNCPLDIIGLLTGNGKAWDHSSVSHSCSEMNKELNFKNKAGFLVYPELTEEMNALRKLIADEFSKVRKEVKAEDPLKYKLKTCPTCGKFMRVKI